MRIDSNGDTSHLEGEPTPHILRCGWSVDDSGMQLGEEPLSYGYGGTAKISVNCQFKDYGVAFSVGDVVGCFLVSELHHSGHDGHTNAPPGSILRLLAPWEKSQL